jgi:hypothetical protein
MDSDPRLSRLIQRHFLLFSASVFAISALLLLAVFMLQRNAMQADAQLWLRLAEEVLKGLLAAAAVAFLFDWILKLESREQLRGIVRDELAVLKDGIGQAGPDTRLDYCVEIILARREKDFWGKPCPGLIKMGLHNRFSSKYLGDEARFALVTDARLLEDLARDSACLFRWHYDLDVAKGDRMHPNWLIVERFRVDGVDWEGTKTTTERSIVVTFRKPRDFKVPASGRVTYEFDLQTIRGSTARQVIGFHLYSRLARPTFRLDARALGGRNVSIEHNLHGQKVLEGPYFLSDEGRGTYQVFVDGTVEAGNDITFHAVLNNAQATL